ncbi:Uncharacterized protein EJ110_NYTH39829 [Nymphaea thermarum]|nr:Uncharacterized protein EJ110_NYTH39829 [Nymphaea thermarum]
MTLMRLDRCRCKCWWTFSSSAPLSPTTTTILLPKNRLHVWFFGVCSSILVWTCLVQLVALGRLWQPQLPKGWYACFSFRDNPNQLVKNTLAGDSVAPSCPYFSFLSSSSSAAAAASSRAKSHPWRIYKSNGYLKVSCNGGLNQMRAAICDMVTVARYLNLTLLIPELDKGSFWADPSSFDDIFDVNYFIHALRNEVRVIRKLPNKLRGNANFHVMQPVSWSNLTYYMQQILPLFSKYRVINFNKTDARLANNGLPAELQKLRCHVNFQALKFNRRIEALGRKLVKVLHAKGPFVALHLRYEMDILAFSGCTHGCSEEEAEELKRMRYAYPWWRQKEIVSEKRRLEGLCPLTPEEATVTLRALGFGKETQIYVASGETYGSKRRLSALHAAYPHIVKKETLLDSEELKQFRNHSSQMAALDYLVSVGSDIFIPTYDGNMAKLVEGHRRYLGFRKTILLDRKKLVEFLDLHQNGTLSWEEFVVAVRQMHRQRMGQPVLRRVVPDRPKEEDYFYANPQECLCNTSNCEANNISASDFYRQYIEHLECFTAPKIE